MRLLEYISYLQIRRCRCNAVGVSSSSYNTMFVQMIQSPFGGAACSVVARLTVVPVL